jgi:DNA-binding NarL/FixJ family response regulator
MARIEDSRDLESDCPAAGSAESPGPSEVGQGHDLPSDVDVLIVDDCTLFRENLAAELAGRGARVTTAWDLPTMVTGVRGGTPEIVLVNVDSLNSGVLIDAASVTYPNARVIVLGVSEDDDDTIVACAEAGVAGYHTRHQSLTDLLALMDNVASGESVCSPRVSAVLLRRLSSLASTREPGKKELVLTTRENQILQMLRVGMSNRDIATQLDIAVHTVKNHVHSLLRKLGVTTRAEAAALSHGLRRPSGGRGN